MRAHATTVPSPAAGAPAGRRRTGRRALSAALAVLALGGLSGCASAPSVDGASALNARGATDSTGRAGPGRHPAGARRRRWPAGSPFRSAPARALWC